MTQRVSAFLGTLKRFARSCIGKAQEFKILLLPFCVFTTSACSVHPLPENTTGFDTVQIVSKVRCEIRDGVRAYVLGALSDPRRVAIYPQYADLAHKLRVGELEWRNLRALFSLYKIDKSTMNVFERYNQGAIAYEFIFNTTENNKNLANLDFAQTITSGLLSGGLAGSSTLNRNNMRTLNVADNFEDLITLFNESYCGPGSSNGAEPIHRKVENIVYPIAGALGLQELVGAFLNLNQSGNLVGLSNAPAQAAMLPTISETMQFTSGFVGGGTFGFAGTQASAPIIRLSKAGFSSTNSREDVHTLRIIMKLPLESERHTRTIAEQRLLTVGIPFRPSASTASLVKETAIVDLSLAPGKEYIETKILVGQSLRLLLPE